MRTERETSTNPLNILMMVLNQTGKGAYWRAFQPAQRLVQRGHQVTLITMSPTARWHSQTFEQQGVTIVEMPDMLWGKLRSGWDIWESLYRVGWLRGQNFDVVHAFESRPTVLLPSLYLHRWRKIPLVMDWSDWFGQGGSVEERPNTLLKTILRPVETFFEECYRTQVDGLTVICTTLQEKALALGVRPENMLFWLDGADTAGLQPLDQQQARQLCQLPADVPMIGYVGAIFYRDAQLMAAAFDAVQAQIPQAKLALIGYVNQPIEEMVKDPSAVLRTGYISFEQVNHYLSACDVCWLPYHNSAANRGRYPMKLNDYMAVARPTVATAVGDVTTMLETHPIGLLTEPHPAALAEKTAALLQNPTWQRELGEAGRGVAENVLSWDIQTDKLEQFYREIVGKYKNS